MLNVLIVMLLGVILLQICAVQNTQANQEKRLKRLEARLHYKRQNFEDFKNYIEASDRKFKEVEENITYVAPIEYKCKTLDSDGINIRNLIGTLTVDDIINTFY